MKRIIGRIWGPVVFLVDTLLLIDIATDLIDKWKNRKAKKDNTEPVTPDTEEEAVPATD